MDLEDFENEIGLTKYQVMQVLLTSIQSIGASLVSQSLALFTAVPDHRCRTPFDDVTQLNETSLFNLTVGSCKRFDYNYSGCSNTSCLLDQGEVGTIQCDDGWIYDRSVFKDSAVTEWDLVCDRRTLSSLASSLFFVGMFIGSATAGILSDWFGRKYTIMWAVLIRDVATVSTAFVPWFAFWVGLRVVTSAAWIALAITRFSHAQEIVPTKWRTLASIFSFSLPDLPNLFMPFVYQAMGDWRKYSLVIGCIGFPLLLLMYFVDESPRWLILHGRHSQARDVAEKIASSAGKNLENDNWKEIIKVEQEKVEKSKESESVKLTYIDLFRYPMTRMITFNVMFGWFVVTMIFYGLIINVTKLAGNPYVNASLNALMERVGDVFMLTSGLIGRRKALFGSFLFAGICCLLSMVLGLTAGTNSAMLTASSAMAIVGQSFATCGFGIIYIVTAEVYPTSVRTLGMGTGSMAGRIGSMLSPFILQLQYTVPWLTQTLFGSLAVIAGFTSLIYPETRDKGLPSTLEETENSFVEQLPKMAKLFRIRPKRVDTQISVTVNEKALEAEMSRL